MGSAGDIRVANLDEHCPHSSVKLPKGRVRTALVKRLLRIRGIGTILGKLSSMVGT